MNGERRASLQDFAERYLVARYPSGGVAVDLLSGNYFQLNRSAAEICALLCSMGNRDAVASAVSRELGISPEEAAHAVDDVAATLSSPPMRGEIQGSYHFHPNERGYGLWHGKSCVLQVDATDLTISLNLGATRHPTLIELYVRSLAPKLLFQFGVTVLHASACIVGNRLVAFAGLSGAGKTTTARAFRDQGATLIAEDLVVLAPAVKRADVLIEGESFIQRWARDAAAQLLTGPTTPISSEGLRQVASGPSFSLDRILFLDQGRRTGTELRTEPVAEANALLTLLSHDFLGAQEPAAWRRYFENAVALLPLVTLSDAWAPAGLEHLPGAVARYISTTAS